MQHDGEAFLPLRLVQTLGFGKFRKPVGNSTPDADFLPRVGIAPETVLLLCKRFWPHLCQGLLNFPFNNVSHPWLKRLNFFKPRQPPARLAACSLLPV
jgi:hypothetical protein